MVSQLPRVWLGLCGEKTAKPVPAFEVETEGEMAFQIASSQSLQCDIPRAMFYVGKNPVYLFCHYEL